MSDARLRLLALFDREDREQADEERREWDARIAVAKARLEGKRFAAVVRDAGHRLNVRTPKGWVSLGNGELVPANATFGTLAHLLSRKLPLIRPIEVR